MVITDLGRMDYRQAWTLQEKTHDEVLAGGVEQIFLVEHPPVITYGRRPGVDKNLVASPEYLATQGVDIVQSDRGGDITYHGPGQIVAYPIIRLIDHAFTVGSYVHTLEAIVVGLLAELGIEAAPDPKAVGVWTDAPRGRAKICAIGVRIRRGVTLHGLALNVETNLSHFNWIVPCGLVGRPVTSLRQLKGEAAPSLETVKSLLATRLIDGLNR
jgi:lipoyl(octanoyl) transferase